ncbi:hypothetical protein CQP30_08645 [Yersinia pestis]|uniref:Membrane protein n=8 Tax=Yersinia pseudotuberculosis complex TaxID=1649845 RepID=A0AAX2I5X0_YERPE|nr:MULTISPECIES: hypothetical protein [Yersinia pseudotuberculosis complex]EDR32001.1 hypothetical protein YPIP275_2234 [Yersinia pestis biovar Orientalis str. IP275]EFA45874.1 conserved hypothetical protein [Yersinia pestis KIM D27]CQD53000.1 membrane protein [Yersinia intermedia]AAM86011.1 hypothetical [Yersinia pestis KIM10+]AAS61776.1 putative membrane protein [Yersinia pestis biovar Microtus str. 91001]
MRQPSISQWVVLVVHPLLAGISSFTNGYLWCNPMSCSDNGQRKSVEKQALNVLKMTKCIKDGEIY